MGRPDTATLTLLLAFLCDKGDGYLARRGYGSTIGHQLDALADVVIYLVPTAIVVTQLLSGPTALESVAGAIVVVFGVLRLARYSTEGSSSDDGMAYYRGLTAFHVAAWALVVKLVVSATTVSALAGATAIVAVSPLMIAPFRIYVTWYQFVGAVCLGSVIAMGTLV